ncbi:50S ribosomal protein L1 [Thecamonas trahens ATCC 50062]|uniref:Ribosomal protein n=1 Tax=Thecamonas trahens ATCC 50062 TaxID=461836 RepID=A0A0L0DA57_THETB|nr:50S ribosomal protein L1 [Thecamonas trahens ATCC 50062]KNC49227.1 50S ribosomal protein L1 [Thecamonas trahens ATCC 50062]|eukprot:XP_013757946.1 50S ribosomal protein L1 [Thecamonas trahens ATCC 50062]
MAIVAWTEDSKIPSEHLADCVAKVLKYANETKKRNFLETIELQIGLKNYDTRKDKRFKGSLKLPVEVKPKMTVCVLGNVTHCDQAAELGLDSINLDTLKTFKRDKKRVKALAAKYDAFLASDNLIKQIPRLLGPGLSKAGKFPGIVSNNDVLADKVAELRSTVTFQLKKVMCLGTAIGDVSMTAEQLETNLNMAINYLVSLLKKNWQNVKSLHIKSTMGPSQQLY